MPKAGRKTGGGIRHRNATIEDGGYNPAAKENALRDTVIFDVASDKVRKDAMALGSGLTFKQVYDLAKVDENTNAQMQIISQGDEKSDLHTLQRESAYSTHEPPPRQSFCYEYRCRAGLFPDRTQDRW